VRDRADAIQRWEAALAAARRSWHRQPAPTRRASQSASWRIALSNCRAHLAAVVAASRPQAPLADSRQAAAALESARSRCTGSSTTVTWAYRIGRRHIRIKETALEAYLAGRIVQPGEITGQDIPPQHLPSRWH
jgi:hypothetical protein